MQNVRRFGTLRAMEWFQVPPEAEAAAPAEVEVVSAQLSPEEARALTDRARG